jgi:hypothetical protein
MKIHSPWPWFTGALLVAAVAVAVILWPAVEVNRASHIRFPVPTPRTSAWHPRPAYYCGGLTFLAQPLPNKLFVATVVNAAPTPAAHQATLTFYNDLVAGRSTASDLVAVQHAYACSN